MTIHITQPTGKFSWKAMDDITKVITQDFHGNQVGLYHYNTPETAAQLNPRMDGIVASIKQGDTFVFQYMQWLNQPLFNLALVQKVKAYGAHTVLFLHDIQEYLFGPDLVPLYIATVNFFNEFDVIIAHTEAMKARMIREGITSEIIVLELFDYLSKAPYQKPIFERKLTLTSGTLEKSPFLYQWQNSTPLDLFILDTFKSQAEDLSKNNPIIAYKGSLEADEIPYRLNSGFGLVWMSNQELVVQESSVTGIQAEYYSTINATYKLSTYLASGIPVVVKSNIAQAELIKRNNWGLVVDDLDQIDQAINDVDQAQYDAMASSVEKISKLLTTGFFTRRIIEKAIEKLFLK
ncbi:MAG: hypothetical protein LBM27_03175 [Lactobacillaceae bacterium]|jgi:hypothetical protein|nr:hypothetical protein [Lactobacillaceae bacterium]